MRGNITVGVVVSTYNSPAYLARVLEGYRLQSRYPDELIVADDGSGPQTAQVVEAFAAKAPFPVRHVWHEDTGFRLAEIRNRAIARAESDYLIFTDGDCVPHPCFVADHARAFRPGSFVTGKRMLVGRELSPTFSWNGLAGALASCLSGALSGGHHLVRLPWYTPGKQGIRGLRGCNIAVARKDLLDINGFNEQIVGWGREDSELVGRLFALGRVRRETPFSAVVFHLWHPENSRASLEENDRLLKESLESGQYRCPCGIVKE